MTLGDFAAFRAPAGGLARGARPAPAREPRHARRVARAARVVGVGRGPPRAHRVPGHGGRRAAHPRDGRAGPREHAGLRGSGRRRHVRDRLRGRLGRDRAPLGLRTATAGGARSRRAAPGHPAERAVRLPRAAHARHGRPGRRLRDLRDHGARAPAGLGVRGGLLRLAAPRPHRPAAAEGRHPARAQLPSLPRHEPEEAANGLGDGQPGQPPVHARALSGARPRRRVPPRRADPGGDRERQQLHARDRGRHQPRPGRHRGARPGRPVRPAGRRRRAPAPAGHDRRSRRAARHGARRRRGARPRGRRGHRARATGRTTSTSTATRWRPPVCWTGCSTRWTRPTRARGSCSTPASRPRPTSAPPTGSRAAGGAPPSGSAPSSPRGRTSRTRCAIAPRFAASTAARWSARPARRSRARRT